MDVFVRKNRRTTLERCEKFISSELSFFNDANLYGKIYPEKLPLKSLTHYAAPGRITYDEAIKGQYKPANVGIQIGPAWSTHWFCVMVEIPAKWLTKEVHLLWNTGSEAMVWKDGKPIMGLSGFTKKVNYCLSKGVQSNQRKQTFYIEVACNNLFGVGDGIIGPPDPNKHFTLSQAEIAIRDGNAYQLSLDLEIITGMAKHLGEASERGNQAMLTANKMVNQVIADGGDSYNRARETGSVFLTQKNGESQHVIHAVGHCHIDSAWLWSYTETIRKCARSWTSTIHLMKEYPNFNFACSQAQQFEWVKKFYPDLYKDIREMIKAGRFIPVGSCWVEMDGNMPSGEAFVRQFLYGQRYFQQEFGLTCKEFWLPDTFGYSGQIPQILRHFGLNRFLTQKISWNLVNKFPHNTFWWEGIDGSRVLTHFPPGDTYCMEGKVEEVLKTRDNHSDKGRSGRSMYLFGYGDGGQGPTQEILEKIKRMEDIDGLPRVEMSTPDQYFTDVEVEDLPNLCTWTGELYLEMHNGTYTTQALTKYYNRKCEFWLHDLEAIAGIASVLNTHYVYPTEMLVENWKLLLLNQFHDVLPGSSIADVYVDALKYYKDVEKSVHGETRNALAALTDKKGSAHMCVFNTLSWERKEVVTLESSGAGPAKKKPKKEQVNSQQITEDGNTLILVTVPSYGLTQTKPCLPKYPVLTSQTDNGSVVLKNGLIEAHINCVGQLTELYVTGCKRNAIGEKQGNVFVIYDDMPLYWDAWDVMDYHLETRKPVEKILQTATLIESGPLRGSVQVSLKISEQSSLIQTISLDAECPYLKFHTQVEWLESHKFLKVEFPTSVKSDNATYEIQFGHLQRPTHTNTSWDSAKFEVCSHKWADLSEYNFGVSILNDCKYGFSTWRNVMSLSLLRSPKAPDPTADMGSHKFTYAIMPHTGSFQTAGVIREGYNLNCPLYQGTVKSSVETQSYFSLDSDQVILETVKQAEDYVGSVVLRLYEAYGGSTTVSLSTTLPFKSVQRCDGYEKPLPDSDPIKLEDSITLDFKPFQLISILMKY